MTDGTAPRTATPATTSTHRDVDDRGRPHVLAATRREFERARLALDMGKASTAVTLLRGCLAVEPDQPEYLGLFGLALCRAGEDVQRARQACERAVTDRPDDPVLHTQLGMVLERLRDHEAARRAYERALELDPQHTLARNGLDALARRRSRFGLRSLLRLLRR
jgi:Flp pilus assembly protein TadD